ncbi:hypothetical protein Tco_0118001 [Tanacetum coccineum]
MTYEEPTPILIEKTKVTRYTVGPGETYTKIKVLGVDKMLRTSDNVAKIRVRIFLSRNGIRSPIISCSCGSKVLFRRNPIGYTGRGDQLAGAAKRRGFFRFLRVEISGYLKSMVHGNGDENLLYNLNRLEDLSRFERKAGRKIELIHKDAARIDKKKVKSKSCSDLVTFARECIGKQLDSKAMYSAFKLKELDKSEEPKALLSIDSMLN